MNFSTNIPDLMSLLVSLSNICLAGAFVGCVLTLVESAFVLSFDGESKQNGGVQPPVTILKPLHGSEPGLAARLSAFCLQDYDAPVQVLCGTQDHTAPAVAAVRDLQPKLPDGALELAVDPRSHGGNGKVSNLINMLVRARHDTIVVSDADIVVEPHYLRALAGLLVAPNVGAVTCLYHGIGEGLWARVSALAINSHFLPQAITAMLPALVSQLVVVLKDTAIGYQITYLEMVRQGTQIGAQYGNYVPALIVIAVLMIAVNVTLSWLAARLEARLRRRSRTAAAPRVVARTAAMDTAGA